MIIDTLRNSNIFSALNEDDLLKVSALFEERKFVKDDYIFFEGDPSHWLYIVSHGRVKMIKNTLDGKEIILEIKSPGEMFCCAAVLDDKPFPESAQTMEDVMVIGIKRSNLIKIMDEYPVLKSEIAKYSSDRLRDAHEMLKNIAFEKVERRIAAVLLKLAEKSDMDEAGYSKIDFQLTRQDLAEMVGTSVETCIRTMSRYQKEGMIMSSENRILVKTDALRKVLEQ